MVTKCRNLCILGEICNLSMVRTKLVRTVLCLAGKLGGTGDEPT